jgi:hypothetical protein
VPKKKKSATPAKPGRRRAMNEYRELKKKIEQRVAILAETIEEISSLGLVEEAASARWKEHLVQVKSSLDDSLLRIAVVGTVKSGKSTLINALLGKDLLKRGAGVITAFITRVITTGAIEGWVEFKPWSQILDELNATLRMIPEYHEPGNESPLCDIRDPRDRDRLRLMLARMQDAWRQRDAHLDPSHLLVRGYLDGYERVERFIGEEANRLVFAADSVAEHRNYVGSEGQAVYLRDVELRHPITWLGESVELADCQGIDSPNPVHFSLLQQYLLKSHFILFAISSRSGLREADFRLLDFIRTLRMFPHTFFVLNADLDDHPNLDDLERLADRVRSELSWMVREPRFFVFSGLYHLLDQLKGTISERDRRHLHLWQEDALLAQATETGFTAFRESLSQEICGQRFRVLCGSGLSRLSMVAGSVMNTAAAQRNFLDHNVEDLRHAVAGLKDREARLSGALTTLKNALAGLQLSLHEDIDRAVHSYFDLSQGHIIKETLDAVEHYPIHVENEKSLGDYRWLFYQFHLVYREFRQSLARYLVEKVNLQVIEFAKSEEALLCERLRRGAEAFWELFATALEDYRKETQLIEAERNSAVGSPGANWQIRSTIAPPNFSALVDHAAIGRGMLLMKLGAASFARLLGDFRVCLEKPKELFMGEKRQESMIQEAIKLLKAEARNELILAFREYQKAFKVDYLYRMADEETRRLMQEFEFRVEMVQLRLGNVLQQGQTEGSGRKTLIESLTQAHQISQAMLEELEALRCTLG